MNMTGRMDILAKLVVTTLILASCGAKPTEPGGDSWDRLGGDMPIRFSADLTGPATKTVSPLPAGSFGVFAFYQPGTPGVEAGTWGDGSGWTPNFMFNQKVDFDGTSAYNYAPLRYWPSNPENTITFWAYYPYEDEDTVDPCIKRFRVVNSATDYSSTAHNIPNIEYTTDGHTDFLVSDVVTDQVYSDTNVSPAYPNTVGFTFGHAMCWIDFIVRKVDPDDIFEMSLDLLRLDNIYFTGVYNQQLGWIATLGDKESILIFESDGDPAHKVVLHDHADPLAVPPVELYSLPASGDPLIMPLPQYLAWTNASIHVTYTMKRGGGAGVQYVCDVPIGDVHPEWERNMHYTYHININPGNPILFTATVETWGAEEEVYYYFE